MQTTQLTEAQIKHARAEFDKFDKDKSGTIDFNELKALLESTLQTKLSDKLFERYVSAYFTQTDKNKDNVIQFEEFLELYKKLYCSNELPISFKPKEPVQRSYVETPSTNAPKKPLIPDLSEEEKAKAREKFKEFDKDNSGYIDRDELKQLLLSVTANKTSPAMIERIVNMHMNSGDKDGDGQIDLEEFYKIYGAIFGSQQKGGLGIPLMGFAPMPFGRK